jgi:predicted DNA-binding transcriptional regulator YafY
VKVIALLQAGKGQNADSLAKRLGVSRRTIFRDLEVLRVSAIPVLYDEGLNQYSIRSPFSLPAMHFSADEALALIILCHEAAGRQGIQFLEAAATAALKLESLLPHSLREEMRSKTGRIGVRLHPRGKIDHGAPIFKRLVDAIARQQIVRIAYHSATDRRVLDLKLSPYQLFFSRHSWYVIGRSSLHREIRTFHVGRIASLDNVGATFHLPLNFNLARYFGNAWHMIPEGKDCEVTVRFHPKVAQNVADVGWHKSQRLVWNPDGSLDFHVTVSGFTEMSWWILAYGDQAEVLRPNELRELIRNHAKKLSKIYGRRRKPEPA